MKISNVTTISSIFFILLINNVGRCEGKIRKACRANPTCSGLTGDCCPTTTGVFLACCNSTVPVAMPVAKPVYSPPVSTKRCIVNPKCNALGLKGECCPTTTGEVLNCCSPVAPQPGPVVSPVKPPAIVPVPKPIAPVPKPIAPVPKPIAPVPKPIAPVPTPISPVPTPIAPVPKPIAPVPTPIRVPFPVPVMKPSAPVPNIMNPKCNANPRCLSLGLVGDCCPTTQRQTLDCCLRTPPKRCSLNPVCASAGLVGDCCPTTSGTFLNCCNK